jgi:hypothetical protein
MHEREKGMRDEKWRIGNRKEGGGGERFAFSTVQED